MGLGGTGPTCIHTGDIFGDYEVWHALGFTVSNSRVYDFFLHVAKEIASEIVPATVKIDWEEVFSNQTSDTTTVIQ